MTAAAVPAAHLKTIANAKPGLQTVVEHVLHLPELAMMLATDLAVMDHADGSILLVANAINVDDTDERVDEAHAGAVERLDRMVRELAAPAPSTVAVVEPLAPGATSNMSPEDFHAMVEQGKEAIRAGEVFQVVLSQRFSVPCPADALDVYRVLRASNPAPTCTSCAAPTPTAAAMTSSGPARRPWSR